MMLQDPAEIDELPKSGIAILRDVETGAGQFVWMRASLQKQMQDLRTQHIKNVEEASRKYGNKPFVVKGEFSTALLTKYFMERSA
jgi:predicted phage gp36 major capsid-like protein